MILPMLLWFRRLIFLFFALLGLGSMLHFWWLLESPNVQLSQSAIDQKMAFMLLSPDHKLKRYRHGFEIYIEPKAWAVSDRNGFQLVIEERVEYVQLGLEDQGITVLVKVRIWLRPSAWMKWDSNDLVVGESLMMTIQTGNQSYLDDNRDYIGLVQNARVGPDIEIDPDSDFQLQRELLPQPDGVDQLLEGFFPVSGLDAYIWLYVMNLGLERRVYMPSYQALVQKHLDGFRHQSDYKPELWVAIPRD